MATPPPPPPDRPTEPLRAVRPAPVVEERIAPAVDPTAVMLRLEDAVESLRTWVAIVGVIAVAALAVATYTLFADDDRDTSASTSTSRAGLATDAEVADLEDRVDRISRQVQDARAAARSNDDTSELSARLDALEDRIPDSDPTQAVEDLAERIETLESDVEALKQAAATP